MNLILLALLFGASDPAPPLQSVGPNVIDGGTARTGPPLTASLTLTHRGEQGTVTVTAVEASCGCTAPTLTSRRLRPGDATDFAISVNTLTQPAGVHTWKATLRYCFTPDDPQAKPQDFDATLAVKADLVLDHGSKIGDGTPDEVRNNSAVIDAYLGTHSNNQAKKTNAPQMVAVK